MVIRYDECRRKYIMGGIGMKAVKVILKVLLFPLYLLLQLLGLLIVTFNRFAIIALHLLGMLFVLGIACGVIYGIWKGNTDWWMILQCAIIGTVIFGLKSLAANAPYYLSGFAKRLMSW